MRYYKVLEDGYILAIGTGSGNVEITAEEYSQIMSVVNAKPTPPIGKDYRLTESFEWEEYDKRSEETDEEQENYATEEDYQAALAEFGVEV